MKVSKEEKIKYFENCYNEKTGKFEFTCNCGIFRELNHKQLWVFNMHKLKCKKCGDIIVEKEQKAEKEEEINKNERIAELKENLEKLKWVKDNMGSEISNLGMMIQHINFLESKLNTLQNN